jgi:hypothetical protein
MLASTKVASVPAHRVLGKVETKSCETWIYFFPVSSSNFKKMYADILGQAKGMGGDAVIDFQIRNESTSYVFLYIFFTYMSSCYSVNGTAVKFTDSGFDGGSSVWDAPPEAATEEQKPKSAWD